MGSWEDGREAREAARAELDAKLAAMGVTLSAAFVPQSVSRNAGEKRPTLNWRVRLDRPGRPSYATDYTQGIAHAPGHPNGSRRTSGLAAEEASTAETGKYPQRWGGSSWMTRRLPPPALADVLWCLFSDAETFGQTFEDWADSFGYDRDSRGAERIYHDCLETGRALAAMFTPAERDELRGLMEAAGF